MANYGKELRMGIDLRRKVKIEKAMEFVERMRKVQEKARATLMKAQEKMKRQVDRGKREVEAQKAKDKMMLSTKNLVFKKQSARKLVNYYIGLYIIDEVVSTNAVKLQLLTSMRIYPVVNVSWIV